MSDDRYIEFNERASAVNGFGAGLLTLFMLGWLWGSWTRFALVAALQITTILFNVFVVNRTVLQRWGVRRGETLRAAVNLATGLVVNRVSGYPLPAWLFLPYVALVYDHLGPRVARTVLVVVCTVQTAAAVLDGVSPKYPLMFSAFAGFCALINHERFRVIRGMLVDADAHREELRRQIAARELAERELVQSQKLEAVGRLAAGMAHEINTPVQFIGDSLQFVSESTKTLLSTIEALQHGKRPSENADLEYLRENVPAAIDMSLQGLGRVAAIVRSMRLYARADRPEGGSIDLNGAVEATLVMAQSEYKYEAEVKKSLGDVPVLQGHAGEINQVILNLLVNAAHAIADRRESKGPLGVITVRTWCDQGFAHLSVSDTGCGIRDSIRSKVFDPFFTTKEVGRGTGQGLSLVRAFVLRHGGDVRFDSRIDSGTTFTIRLPCAGRDTAVEAA